MEGEIWIANLIIMYKFSPMFLYQPDDEHIEINSLSPEVANDHVEAEPYTT